MPGTLQHNDLGVAEGSIRGAAGSEYHKFLNPISIYVRSQDLLQQGPSVLSLYDQQLRSDALYKGVTGRYELRDRRLV